MRNNISTLLCAWQISSGILRHELWYDTFKRNTDHQNIFRGEKKIRVCDKRLKGLFIFNLASNNPKRNILQVPTEESKLLSASPVSKTRSYKIRAFHWISGNTFKQWDFFNNGTYYLWLVVDSPSLEVFKESLDSHLLEILYALDFLHWEGRWSRWHIRLLIPWLYDHPIWPHIITGT